MAAPQLPFVENPLKPPHCLGCPLYSAPGPVFGPPAKPNKILFLGEAPGRDEVSNWMRWQNDPKLATQNPNFTGGSGRVLRAWCRHIGVDPSSVEMRNTVKCRPTAIGAMGTPIDRAPTEEEIRHCAPFLARELEVVDPNLIVGLGATALTACTGHSPITKWRGQILEGPLRRKDGVADVEANRRYKFLSVYHPAYVMRSQENTPIAVFDLSKLKAEAQTPEIHRVVVDYNTTGVLRGSSRDFLEKARRVGYVVFDFEAEGITRSQGRGLDLRTGTITLVGLSHTPYVVEVLHWTPDTQQLFAAIAGDPTIEIVGQNSEIFDIPYAESRGITFNGPSFDTLQAFHLTNPEQAKNIEFIASLSSDVLPWKGKQMYKSGFEALKLGNAKDVDTAGRQYLESKKELRELGMEDLYQSVAAVQPVLRKMGYTGIRRNEELNWKWRRGAEALSAQLAKRLHDVIGYGVDLDSPKQLASLLYDQLGLTVQYRVDRKRGKHRTVDKHAMEKLELLHPDNPIFSLIVKRRKVEKLNSTYLQLESDEEGFIHPHFGSARGAMEEGETGSAARNGRLISWEPTFHNQPIEVREQYVPRSEHVFIEADWKQVEWAVAMVLAGEPRGLELLAAGADNHSITAAECFNISVEEVLRRDREAAGGPGSPRFETKFIVYGLGYGRGAADIALQLRRDITWVNGFIARFRNAFPVYWEWRTNLERHVAAHSYLRNPFGRRRWWYSRQVTEMYNFPPSSTAADMMIRSLTRLSHELPRDAKLLLTVHDSVLVDGPKDLVRPAYECIRDVMQSTWPQILEASARPEVVRKYFPQGWSCPVDIHLGTNWRETKKGNKKLEDYLLGKDYHA